MDAAVSGKTTSTSASRPARRVPLRERINLRMIIVGAVFGCLIGYPVYMLVDASINHGVKQMGDVAKVDLKALGNFPFDEVNGTITDVPRQYRELDGKKVLLEGFPYVTKYAGDEAPEFEFVYNVAKCCFGGPPKVQERVFAKARPGQSVPNYHRMFATLEGTLHVKVDKEEGRAKTLYTLDIDKITATQ